MIKLYEVKVPLDGYTMCVLMASPDAQLAISEVAKQLRASVDMNHGNFNWRQDEMTAVEITVREIA